LGWHRPQRNGGFAQGDHTAQCHLQDQQRDSGLSDTSRQCGGGPL